MSASRLAAVAAKSERVVVGLNSGTSMDGIDALCARVEGAGTSFRARVLAWRPVPFAAGLRERLLRAPEIELEEAAHLHVELGRAFAGAASEVTGAAGLATTDVDLVGSHGQTLYHRPTGDGGRGGVTFQAGDLDVVAELTGAVTVGDFRARDVAAGGAGAPLMPYLDWVLFRERPRTVTLNVGGVASVTAVAEDLEACLAFDVGPANLPLDVLASRLTGGSETYDPGGRLAAEGTVDPILLDRLLAHPFLALPPPRTTGREMFGEAFVEDVLRRNEHLSLRDILATVCAFVARAIHRAVTEDLKVDGGPRELVVSGGGLRNLTLMRQLKQLFSPVPVTSIEDHGFDADAKEALLYALLANERLYGAATNVPRCTGARWPVSLGKIAL